ncbi:SurA N-terminal domain-containing protein [Microbacterium halophytorum]|uniref:SurA N-terminal domain-containing protein n=1 Tax=Microbacterium halophytorum TaxID=2067568 RepID=UPI001E571F3B|nr:SurA N-terminal domain-containing protein [Microbacterium halophytorum]
MNIRTGSSAKLSRALLAGSVVAMLALAGCSAEHRTEDSAAKESTETAAPEAGLEGLPDVVAVVNGEEIGLDEYTEAYESQMSQAEAMQQQSGQEVDQDLVKQQAAELLVNNVLLTQAAADAGIEATDEGTDKVLEELAAQAGLGSVDEVIAAFDEHGVSEKEVREDAAGQFVIDEYVEEKTDVAEPTDAELKQQYEQLVEQSKAAGGEAEVPAFDDVKAQLKEQTVSQDRNAQIQKVIDGLRESGDVEIKI